MSKIIPSVPRLAKAVLRFNSSIANKKLLSDDDWKIVETDIRNITSDNYEKLKRTIKKEYLTNSVYGVCILNKQHYIIVMEKVTNTNTHEFTKEVFDADYSECGAKELFVKQIISLTNMELDISSITVYITVDDGDNKMTIKRNYTVGSVIKSNEYFKDPLLEYFNTINYYKNLHAAYFLTQTVPKNHSGFWFFCDSRGKLENVTEYKDGNVIRMLKIELGNKLGHLATLINIQKFYDRISPYRSCLYSSQELSSNKIVGYSLTNIEQV
jgi:hypothetical protein